MNKQLLLDYCMKKPGSEQDYQEDWHANRIKVRHKMYALLGEVEGRPILSLKCAADQIMRLRTLHQDIVPGFFLNKSHWNSIYLDGDFPLSQIYPLIDLSYDLVVSGLPDSEQQKLHALAMR